MNWVLSPINVDDLINKISLRVYILLRNSELIKNIKEPIIDDILLQPIEKLKLSKRAFICLKNAKINTILDLVQLNEWELKKFRNIGAKSFSEIEFTLEEMGLSLGMDIDYLTKNQTQK